MTILINASNLKEGGGLQVADSFITQLGRFSSDRFIVLLSSQLLYLRTYIDNFPNVAYFHYDHKTSILGILNGRAPQLDSLVREYHIQAVFTIFGPPLWHPKVPHIVGFARAQIIYKDSPFWRDLSLRDTLTYTFRRRLNLWNFSICSDILITENRDVSSRLNKLLPALQVHTVTNTYNQVFEHPEQWIDVSLPPFDGLTVLTVSANYAHKNLKIIREVAEFLFKYRPDFRLRFVLTLTQEEFPVPRHLQNTIYLVGRVPIVQCPSLYKQSDVMFLPTLLECFTASYAEAMKMQVPILTSDLPFAHGLCGEAAFYCDTLSVSSIVTAIERLSHDISLRELLVSAGKKRLVEFDSPFSRAQKYIKIIKTHANNQL